MKILIKNGKVVDPAQKLEKVMDVLIEKGKIASVQEKIEAGADLILDASERYVLPGLIDLHVHLREPGREDKETIQTGTRAALKGGVTTLLAMPNTSPCMDLVETVRNLKETIKKTALVNVLMSAAITIGRRGEELTDFAALKKEGIAALTDDGSSVESENLMRQALERAKKEDLLVIAHCEDGVLAGGGLINKGYYSTILGLRGISAESEFLRVEREIRLAKETGARLHLAHLSCAESVERMRFAKKSGLRVSAETAPHYFALTEEDLVSYDTNFKMNPPLRSQNDKEQIILALSQGVIDCIASDHAPHTESDKEIEFDRAEFGVTGLETELSVAITELVLKGALDWSGLVERMSWNPAKILGLKQKGTLAVGSDADIVIVDPAAQYTVTAEGFVSKSKNSSFLGRVLRGVVDCTLCAGVVRYSSKDGFQ